MSYFTLGYATRPLPLGYATRSLPMGRITHRQLSLGDDGADDWSEYDFAPEEEVPTFSATPVTNQDLSAPDITEQFNFAPPVGPAAPGEIYDISQIAAQGSSADLNQLILSGQIPPPTGSNLTPYQVSQLAAKGASAEDIGAVLTGQATPQNILTELAQAAQLATKTAQVVMSLPSTPTGKAPTPTTTPVGYVYNAQGQLVPVTTSPGTVTSALNSVESWFSEPSTIFPGISNGVFSIGVIAALAVAGAVAGRHR